ncbi:hypothetical protein LF41_2417 [Lysobacter dokdonensis DS-58]|uniref:Uncharacterized protein n=1 Tax=Lysobacter dokdonensis DS-58 TaxID=1300345 RepID=A0A0A2WNP0_9GAMM|nr:hypothetical protein LF41_2417 [Lysobacter dokdonensis DS-58]
MTPDKRATLLKALVFIGAGLLLVFGYISQDVWLHAVIGS